MCALVIIHMLQADMLQADTRATPCSQPFRSSVIHGISSVTDIPECSNGFNSKDNILWLTQYFEIFVSRLFVDFFCY